MFKKWKRVLAIVLALSLPILSSVWSAFLNKWADPPKYLPYVYVGAISLIAAAVAYFTNFGPVRDPEKPLLLFLGMLAEGPIELGTNLGIGPRMALMVAYRPWYAPWRKRLRIVWSVKMDSQPDVRFECYSGQGICGMAMRDKLPQLADCEVADKSHFRFSKKQLHQTRLVTAVFSWPIYGVDSKGNQTDSIVGVVNLDATTPGSFAVMSKNLPLLDPLLKKFAEVASKMI